MTEFLIRHCIKTEGGADDPAVRTAYGKLAGVVGIVCNLLLCAGKFAVGLAFGSLSVLADAVNNLSDASSSVITLLGFRLSEKPADKEHPFGHARFEYVAGMAVSVLILVIGVELGRSGVERIIHPQAVLFTPVTAAVLLLSIAMKMWMAFFNRTLGERIQSAALKATFLDSRNDALSTSAVLAASVLAHYTALPLDGWMTLAVAVFVLFSGVGILRDTLDPLLGEAPSEEVTRQIEETERGHAGILGTHDLMVHDYGSGNRFASVHVEMAAEDNVLHSHEIVDHIEQEVLEKTRIHLVIHIDPITADAARKTEKP